MFVSALVNVFTGDIEAGLRFYQGLLGFEEMFRTPTEGTPEHVELMAAGVPVVREPHATGNNNRNALFRDPDGNLVEIVAKVH